jgi:putative transposase
MNGLRTPRHRRICEELAKLGFRVSPTSIRRLLVQGKLEPAPRRSGPSWREFLHAQAASILACDFYDRRADIHEALLALGCCLVCFRRLQRSF